ncbi:hypothetical protein [uncultured Roseovarius sp.]|uniref:hypothetical protein n=1 Tax=uncultured Roseovarius sp. TaxID=293344 RepID=UPI00260890BD|nr:hypothetical protein [uncultured Roseovarius sp.]
MRSYDAARNLFGFLGFCSWGVIALGVIAAFGGVAAISGIGRDPGGMQVLMASIPGLGLAVFGLVGLAMVQIGRAGVDSAEYAQQSLDVSRQQLEISKQQLAQGNSVAQSYAAAPKPADKPTAGEPISYGTQAGSAASLDTSTNGDATPSLPETNGTDAQIEQQEAVPLAQLEQSAGEKVKKS